MADNNDLSLISAGLYRIVSEVVGQDYNVKIRRQSWKIHDSFINSDDFRESTYMTSGSRSEGFEFYSSDIDAMHLDRKSYVLNGIGINQVFLESRKIPTRLVMETDFVTPGYALIRCVTCDYQNTTVFNSLVLNGGDAYLSSKLVRESFLSLSTSTLHGPCQQVRVRGYEFDRVFTLNCPIWPLRALSFVNRSLHKGWPSYDMLTDLCKDGCFLIPINSKQQFSCDLCDLEWRISFSVAEKKLIHSMNHCQFLCYGLSKLLLDEVLKKIPPVEDLVCSYFMKTALFWEISSRPQNWTTQNFFEKFWNVFERFIRLVLEGYCPNFIIPENNMFKGKIYGANQRALLSVLRDLHSDGLRSLLRCSSLNQKLSIIVEQPILALVLSCTEDEEYVSSLEAEIERIKMISNFDSPFPHDELGRILTILNNTVNLEIESEEMRCAIRLRANYILHKYAECLIRSIKSWNHNRISNKKICRILKAAQLIPLRTITFFSMNYITHAKLIYMAGNYPKTLEIIKNIKNIYQRQLYMYKWCLDGVNVIMSKRRRGMSYDTLIKSTIASYVDMHISTAIEELQLECIATGEATGGSLFIYPIVFLNFLEFLCYTRLGYLERRNDILEELRTFLCENDDYRFDAFLKPISWEILGICQQICGDCQTALQSYENALNDENNYFKDATILRILAAISQSAIQTI